jgi:uncharacterized protein YodC (DUF2158 family)
MEQTWSKYPERTDAETAVHERNHSYLEQVLRQIDRTTPEEWETWMRNIAATYDLRCFRLNHTLRVGVPFMEVGVLLRLTSPHSILTNTPRRLDYETVAPRISEGGRLSRVVTGPALAYMACFGWTDEAGEVIQSFLGRTRQQATTPTAMTIGDPVRLKVGGGPQMTLTGVSADGVFATCIWWQNDDFRTQTLPMQMIESAKPQQQVPAANLNTAAPMKLRVVPKPDVPSVDEQINAEVEEQVFFASMDVTPGLSNNNLRLAFQGYGIDGDETDADTVVSAVCRVLGLQRATLKDTGLPNVGLGPVTFRAALGIDVGYSPAMVRDARVRWVSLLQRYYQQYMVNHPECQDSVA